MSAGDVERLRSRVREREAQFGRLRDTPSGQREEELRLIHTP